MSDVKPKKYGAPRAKYGQIKVQYGYTADEGHDFYMAYGGHKGGKRAARMLMSLLTRPRYNRLDHKNDPSVIEVLEEAGYDTKTLKISVEMKPELLEAK